MVKLFIKYNGEGGKKMDFAASQYKGSFHIKATVGVASSQLSVENSLSETFQYDFSNETAFRIGAEVEYVFPFNRNKWSLFIEPNYQSFKWEATQDGTDWKVNYKFIELPVGIRHYMYINSESKVFIDAACVFAFTLGDSYLQRNDTSYDLSRNLTPAFGVGYSYQKFSAEIRFNFKQSILQDYYYWNGGYNSASLILGYRIF